MITEVCNMMCTACPEPARDFAADALRQVYEVSCQWGTTWEFWSGEEEHIERDAYGSIVSRDNNAKVVHIPAFPVEHSPDQRRIDAVGVKGQIDVILTTPTVAWENEGIKYQDIDKIRWQAVGLGQIFSVESVQLRKNMGGIWLYAMIALKAK